MCGRIETRSLLSRRPQPVPSVDELARAVAISTDKVGLEVLQRSDVPGGARLQALRRSLRTAARGPRPSHLSSRLRDRLARTPDPVEEGSAASICAH